MPTFINSAQVNDQDGNSSATIGTFTAGAGSRRYAIAYMNVSAGSIAAHNSVTWGGVSMTQRGSSLDVGSFGRVSEWILPEASWPSGGTGAVVGTCASSQDQIVLFIGAHSDVNQAGPFTNGAPTTATGSASNSPSLTVPSTATDLVVANVIGVNSTAEDDTISVNAGTSREEVEVPADYTTYAMGTIAGASPNVAQSWTFAMTGGDTMSNWGMIGDSLVHDGGGGGGGVSIPVVQAYRRMMGMR